MVNFVVLYGLPASQGRTFEIGGMSQEVELHMWK